MRIFCRGWGREACETRKISGSMRKRVTYQLARGDAALVDRFSKFTKTKWTVHTHVRVRRPYGLVMHQYSSRGAAAGHSGTTLHSPHWRPHTHRHRRGTCALCLVIVCCRCIALRSSVFVSPHNISCFFAINCVHCSTYIYRSHRHSYIYRPRVIRIIVCTEVCAAIYYGTQTITITIMHQNVFSLSVSRDAPSPTGNTRQHRCAPWPGVHAHAVCALRSRSRFVGTTPLNCT